MAVTNVPGWIGSSAVTQTGKRWMSQARTGLSLPAQGWMSEMAGLPKEFIVIISASNHAFVPEQHLHPLMLAAAGGSWPTVPDTKWIIRVMPGVQLVAANTSTSCFTFVGAIRGKVVIENHGWIFGRGGNGGWADRNNTDNGASGGPAIYREPHITLEIINYGLIAGGGGGGGGGRQATAHGGFNVAGGGGGAPFGGGAYVGGRGNGSSASITGGGAGGRDTDAYGGNGGGLGSAGAAGRGGSGRGQGGPAGYALSGSGPVIWTARGDVRGPTT